MSRQKKLRSKYTANAHHANNVNISKWARAKRWENEYTALNVVVLQQQ